MKIPFFSNKNKTINKSTQDYYSLPENWQSIYSSSAVTRTTIKELYKKNADVNSVVNYIAQSCANIILNLEHYRGDTEIKNSKIIELIHNPNDLDSALEFWKKAIVSYIVDGNTFLNKIKPVGYKDYSKLYLLNMCKVYPYTNYSTDNYGNIKTNTDTRFLEITSYKELLDSVFIQHAIEDIIHVKDVSVDSAILGTSRLYAAVKNANILNAMNDTLETVLTKGGALGFIKKTVRTNELAGIDPDEKKRIEENFYKYGTGNGKKPIFFTSQDLNFVKILSSISEFMPQEITALNFRAICTSVGGLPEALFLSSDTTFTNLKTAEKLAYTMVSIPIVKSFVNCLTIGLGIPTNESLKIDYDDIECLQEDNKLELETQKIEDEIMIQRYNDGLITRYMLLEELGIEKNGKDGYKIDTETSPTT